MCMIALDPTHYRLVLALAGFAFVLAAWAPAYTKRRPLSLPMVLVSVGAVVFALPGMPDVDPREHLALTEHLTEFGVIIALLGAGLKLDRPIGLHRWGTTWRLLGVSMLLTIAGTAVLGWAVAGLAPATALLLGAILAPTDPVLAADVQVGEPSVDSPDATTTDTVDRHLDRHVDRHLDRRVDGRVDRTIRPGRRQRRAGSRGRCPIQPDERSRTQRRIGVPIRLRRHRHGRAPLGRGLVGDVVPGRRGRAGRHRCRGGVGDRQGPRTPVVRSAWAARCAVGRAGRLRGPGGHLHRVWGHGAGTRLWVPRRLHGSSGIARLRTRSQLPPGVARLRRPGRATRRRGAADPPRRRRRNWPAVGLDMVRRPDRFGPDLRHPPGCRATSA